ncbi:ACT domain-containing protein [Streptomyces mirabilis]
MKASLAQHLRIVTHEFFIEHRPDGHPPTDDEWYALMRAPEGLTVVRKATSQAESPGKSITERQRWVGFYGDTAHGLDLPGMLNAVVSPLAAAAVPVFVTSTFHSDLVLVPQERRSDACAALRTAGHEVSESM